MEWLAGRGGEEEKGKEHAITGAVTRIWSEEDFRKLKGEDLQHESGKFLSFLELPDEIIHLGKNRRNSRITKGSL